MLSSSSGMKAENNLQCAQDNYCVTKSNAEISDPLNGKSMSIL